MAKFAGSQARALGAEIRKHRESLDWTLDTLSTATDVSRSTLSRIETGTRRATVDEVASILTALRVTGAGKERLIRLASDGSCTWVCTGDSIAQQLSAVSAYEAEATDITDFQISVFPGLLQTADYSRRLISTSPTGSAERERAVFTRMGRQSVLSRPGLTHYQAYIDETAFRREVGSSATMATQLRHVWKLGQEQGKSVRIIPFAVGAYWGCEGSFSLYGFGAKNTVVYQENQGAGIFIEDYSAKVYNEVLKNLSDVALSDADSHALILSYLEWYGDDV